MNIKGAGEHEHSIYNFQSGRYEYTDIDLSTATVEQLEPFVPQGPGAGMLQCLVKMGESPQEAMIKVLSVAVGDK